MEQELVGKGPAETKRFASTNVRASASVTGVPCRFVAQLRPLPASRSARAQAHFEPRRDKGCALSHPGTLRCLDKLTPNLHNRGVRPDSDHQEFRSLSPVKLSASPDSPPRAESLSLTTRAGGIVGLDA